MTGTFFSAETASLTKIQIEFVQPSFWRDLNRIVRAVHKAVATIETLTTTETSFSLIDNRLKIKWWIYFLEMLKPHVDG